MKKRSGCFASPLALGMGAQVHPEPRRVRTLPEGSIGLGGVVTASHVEERDGVAVRVIDEFDIRYVSTNGRTGLTAYTIEARRP